MLQVDDSLAPIHPMESTYPTITVVDQLVAIQGRLYLAALLGIDGKNLLLAFLDQDRLVRILPLDV